MTEKQKLVERWTHLSGKFLEARRNEVLEDWPNLELTFPQFRVLMTLASGPRRMSDLVEALGGQFSTMTAIVDRLVAKNLVERGNLPSDRRVVMCSLTTEGKDAVSQMQSVNQVNTKELAEYMSVEELELVIKATEVIVDAMERQAKDG